MIFMRDCRTDFININDVQMIVFEAPFAQGKGATEAIKTMGVIGMIDVVAKDRYPQLPTYQIDISTNKKFFTGNGYASKVEMVRMARLYGWRPKNDDEADALALWSYAINWRYPRIFANRKLSADFRGPK
jgi:Holliday junction resolvasome RuvABC endonuclease subunit